MEGNSRDDGGDGGGAQTQVPIPDPNPSSPQTRGFKAKSCKGTAYYSSGCKSKSKNPIRIGFPRKFQQVPFPIEREIVEGDVGSPTYFKYVCAGYSVYLDSSADPQDEPVKFPICYGFKWMMYTNPSFSAAGHVATPVQKNEERQPQPQPRYKPPNTKKEE